MMKRARRMSLVVLLLLFASAGTAFDDGAVLEPQRTLIQALPTRPDCIAAVEGRYRARSARAGDQKRKTRQPALGECRLAGWFAMVEGKGFEPSTSALRTPRSPN